MALEVVLRYWLCKQNKKMQTINYQHDNENHKVADFFMSGISSWNKEILTFVLENHMRTIPITNLSLGVGALDDNHAISRSYLLDQCSIR